MSDRSASVTTDVRERRAHVTLSGGRGNAVDDAVLDGLLTTFQAAEADDAVDGILLRAEGKLFSPGLDLVTLVAFDREAMARFMARFSACVLHMYTCSKPVVASLSGHALAGGAILALTADWRVLREDALVGLNELKVGVPLPAVDAGLVHEVAPGCDLEGVALKRLREMTSKDLRSFAVTKAYLRSRTVERIRAFEGQFLDEWLDCWFSPGTRARVEAIVADLTARKSG
jgi:enoyl-CoA hydratase